MRVLPYARRSPSAARHDARTLTHEQAGDLEPDPSRRARDEAFLPAQSEVHERASVTGSPSGSRVGSARSSQYTDRLVEDYTNKYKGEQVEVALFGGEYQEGVLTAYCSIEDVPHVELNGHILIPLQNVASLHCSSRCDAPEPDWPPRGLTEDDAGEA